MNMIAENLNFFSETVVNKIKSDKSKFNPLPLADNFYTSALNDF